MVRLKKMGLRSGVADLVIIKEGCVFFLELKRRLGKQSANQLLFEADAIRAGADYAVAHSFDEAVNILKSWEIIA
jgi:predicted type IV restriction endonuclease